MQKFSLCLSMIVCIQEASAARVKKDFKSDLTLVKCFTPPLSKLSPCIEKKSTPPSNKRVGFIIRDYSSVLR